jgi:nicotinamidase-related amidase
MARCLLNIDLIEECLKHLAADDASRIVAATNELVALFRRSNLLIIWVRQEFEPDLSDAFLDMRKRGVRAYVAGASGARLDARPGDHHLIKKRYSAFFGTGLDSLLQDLGVDELILTGVNTHACVRTTAVDAYHRDLEVILAADCLASYDAEHAAISMRYMDGKIGQALGNDEIRSRLAASA